MTPGFVGFRAEMLRRINLDEIRSEGCAVLMEMKFTLQRSATIFDEFPIIFSEREFRQIEGQPQILLKACALPSKALVKRVRSA
jgi:hypothetical protein